MPCFLILFTPSDWTSREKQERVTPVLVYSVAEKTSDTGDCKYHQQKLQWQGKRKKPTPRKEKESNNISVILCRCDVQKNTPTCLELEFIQQTVDAHLWQVFTACRVLSEPNCHLKMFSVPTKQIDQSMFEKVDGQRDIGIMRQKCAL